MNYEYNYFVDEWITILLEDLYNKNTWFWARLVQEHFRETFFLRIDMIYVIIKY